MHWAASCGVLTMGTAWSLMPNRPYVRITLVLSAHGHSAAISHLPRRSIYRGNLVLSHQLPSLYDHASRAFAGARRDCIAQASQPMRVAPIRPASRKLAFGRSGCDKHR